MKVHDKEQRHGQVSMFFLKEMSMKGKKEKKKISIRKIALSRGGGMEEPKRT